MMKDFLFRVFGFICVAVGGAIIGFNLACSEVRDNRLEGYHCGKLTKHKTLDSDKKQVEINQASSAALTRG